MKARTRVIALAVGGAVVLASGAYALGTQAGGGDATAARSPARARLDGPRPGLDALARRLGVDEARLRAAFQDLWRSRRPLEGERQTRLAARLAAALGVPTARVRAALTRLRARYGWRTGHPGPPGRPPAEPGGTPGSSPGGPPPGVWKDRPPGFRDGAPPGFRDGPPPGFRHGPPPGFRHGFGHGAPPGLRGAPPEPLVAALAHELGVSSARVRSALDRLRSEHRSDERERRHRFAAELAAQLRLPVARVEAALPAPPGPSVHP